MGCNIFLGKKLANTCSFVGWHIIMQQEKISRAERSWTNPLNALQGVIHYTFIKFCIYCSSLWYEFLCTTPWETKKKFINMVMMRDLWNFSFFSQGDVSPTHSELCSFVSGAQAKHQVSFPIIIVKKNFVCIGCRNNVLARCDSIFPFLRCQGVWNKMCTPFSFPNPLSESEELQSWGCSNGSAIILHAIWWSFLTKSATAAIFTSVRVDFGRPPLPSSSTSSLLSRNREYHLKTFDRFGASFP